ncbi:MAG: hypothetical protein AAGG02_09355 [Cyanobacteria bacterium P01_H01_bin.15]
MGQRLLNGINTLLVIDIFLIFAAFAWFAIAAVGQSFGWSLGLDLWHRLWTPVFNPAIGIFFLGCLISWLGDRVRSWRAKS